MVRLTDRPDMTIDVYRGRKSTMQQQQQISDSGRLSLANGIDARQKEELKYDVYYIS